jgi:hypothetical protein
MGWSVFPLSLHTLARMTLKYKCCQAKELKKVVFKSALIYTAQLPLHLKEVKKTQYQWIRLM